MASSSAGNVHRPGGRQKRQKIRDAQEPLIESALQAGILQSKLARYLVSEWSWGHFSAPDVQRLASAALYDEKILIAKLTIDRTVKDEFLTADLVNLGRIGSDGKYPGNCHRDLQRFLGSPKFPATFVSDVEIKLQKTRATAKAATNAEVERES